MKTRTVGCQSGKKIQGYLEKVKAFKTNKKQLSQEDVWNKGLNIRSMLKSYKWIGPQQTMESKAGTKLINSLAPGRFEKKFN